MEKSAQLKKIHDLREKYAQQRIDLKLGKMTNTSLMKKTRRSIARALTELNAVHGKGTSSSSSSSGNSSNKVDAPTKEIVASGGVEEKKDGSVIDK